MKDRKKTLPSILFAIGGVAFLFAGLEERIIDGGPIHYVWLSLAGAFFAVAVVFAMAIGRKSGGGAGSPPANA